MTGRKLEDFYTVARELGSGGFSTVRLGVNKKPTGVSTKNPLGTVPLGTEVAIKTIMKSRAFQGDNALIRNEINIMTYVLQNKAIMNTTHVVRYGVCESG
jgi:serine/threonine protein kinase